VASAREGVNMGVPWFTFVGRFPINKRMKIGFYVKERLSTASPMT